MTLSEFQDRIFRTGCYETPACGSRRLIDRIFGRFDAWYYALTIRNVLGAYCKVRVGCYDTRAWAITSFVSLRLVERCGGRICIESSLRKDRHSGPAVFIANHMSMLETFLLPCMLQALSPGGLVIVVKESLLRYPVFGAVLGAAHPIRVGRRSAREDLVTVLEQGAAALAEGRSALVFPQSTRRAVIRPEDFNSIGVKLARRAGVPVVPVALKTDFQGIGGWLRDFGSLQRSSTVRFRFGDPVYVTGNGRAEHDRLTAYLVETVTQWQTQAPA